jgi:hypothetical protein
MKSLILFAGVAAAVLALTIPVSAQWARHTPPGTPKNAEGKPDLTAPTPRTADGKPDLSGVWVNGGQGAAGRRAGGAPPPPADPTAPPTPTFFNAGQNVPGGLPFQEWAAELRKQRTATNAKDNPDAHCLPMGFLQFHMHPQPRKIVQTPAITLIIFEANYGLRQIFTDGRKLPPPDANPTWEGYSTGRWEGDTLVVESSGFRDGGWLDVNGSPFTDQLKLTERFTRVNYGTLRIDITVDDPKAYTKPWTVRITQRLTPEDELIEFVCNENEQSSRHYINGDNRP